MKKFLLLSAAILLALTNCQKASENPSNVELKLSADTIKLNYDGKLTAQLSVVEPLQYKSDKRIRWTSSNEKCVTVDAHGVVTAISPGESNVYAFVDELHAVRGKSVIIVDSISTARINLETTTPTFNVGGTIAVKYRYSEEVVGREVETSSSDTIGGQLISCVIDNKNQQIKVIGVAPGRVRLKVFNKYTKAIANHIELTVVGTPITDFQFTKTFDQLNVGDKDTLKVAILPKAAAKTPVKWSVNDSYYATVDADGLVSALRKGVVTVFASTNFGTILSHTITINDPNAKNFAFESKTMSINIGFGTELIYPINFKLDPTVAQNPTVNVIASYVPKKGVKSDIQVAKLANGMVVLYAPHTLSSIGSAALVAYNGSTDKDGKLITDTCIVSAANFSPNVLVAKAVYTGIDFGAKIAPVAKFISFLNEPITVKKVQLIKIGKTETIIESLNVNETINNALTVKSFTFTPITCTMAQISGYVVRYTVEINNSAIESTFDRSLVVDNGQALVKGVL